LAAAEINIAAMRAVDGFPHGVKENRQVVIEGVAGRQGVIVRKAGNYRLSAPKQFVMQQLTSAH